MPHHLHPNAVVSGIGVRHAPLRRSSGKVTEEVSVL
jgi:hypothetical protein